MQDYQTPEYLRDPAACAIISPQIALAIAEGVQLAPTALSCKLTMSSTATTIYPAIALEKGEGATISQASVVVGASYQIDQPLANQGGFLKAQEDFYFGEQSGITAMLEVVGVPKYSCVWFYEPLRVVRDSVNRAAQNGWVLSSTQSLRMSFQIEQPSLLTPPTTITFGFLLLQPAGTDKYTYMSAGSAIKELLGLGVSLPEYVQKRVSP